MQRPRVLTKCVADHYHGPVERIIEFDSKPPCAGAIVGGLISFRYANNGTLRIDIYRCDPGVEVVLGEEVRNVTPKRRGKANDRRVQS